MTAAIGEVQNLRSARSFRQGVSVVNLTGNWHTSDYECPLGVKNIELVAVAHEGERIVATKITGDDCVPAGFETFSGRFPVGGQIAAITWTCGTPRAPASTSVPGYLKITSKNEFRAGAEQIPEMTFVRDISMERD